MLAMYPGGKAALLAKLGRVPYAGFALAFDAKNGQFWAGGTNYGAASALPGYSYARTGTEGFVDAHGVVQSFAANVPPIIPGVGYEAYGAVTNGLLQSQALDNASWTNTAITVTANAATAPDGTATADQLSDGAGTSNHQLQQSVSYTSGNVYAFSVMAKAGTGQFLQLIFPTVPMGSSTIYANYDIVNGTVTASGVGATASIVNVGGGWYRCVLSAPASATSSGATSVDIVDTGAAAKNASFLGTGRTIFTWQAQVLAGAFPDGGPIIPTTTAAASAGDNLLTTTIPALADQDMLIIATATRSQAVTGQLIYLSDNGTAEISLQSNGDRSLTYSVRTTGPAIVYESTVAVEPSAAVTLLLRRLSGNWRAGKVVGGVLTWFTVDTAGAMPAGLVKVGFGNAPTGAAAVGGSLQGAFIRPGTFATDAAVLAALPA